MLLQSQAFGMSMSSKKGYRKKRLKIMKDWQRLEDDSVTKEAIHLSPEELSSISESLNKHLQAEAKSLELADAALRQASSLLQDSYSLCS